MKEFKQISTRLQTIASFIEAHSIIADIGSDHAYLPSYLCLKDDTIQAIAGEVSKGPFERAKETVAAYNLQDRIDVRLGSGLSILKESDKVSTIIIAGMGGGLIASILTEGAGILPHIDQLVLQPNTNGYIVRKTLINFGFTIQEEKLVDENDHIYEIIVAKATEGKSEDFTEKQLFFGPYLMEEANDIFLKKWQEEYDKLKSVIEQMKQSKTDTSEKLASYELKAKWMEEILS